MTDDNMMCGCVVVPEDDPQKCCEDCPEESYGNCPGQDECYVVAEYNNIMRGCEIP